MENIKEAIEDLKLEIKSNEEELPYSKEVLQRNKILLNYIEQLEKENKELKERVKVFDKAVKCDKCDCNICDAEKLLLDSIPKSVIRDKIEEISKEYIKWDAYEDNVKLGLLKEILGDE